MPVRGRRYIKVYRWVRENTPLSFSGGSRSRAGRSHRRRPPRRSRLSNRSRQPAPEKPTRTEQHASGRKRTSRVSEKFRSRDFPAQFVQASILRPHRVRPAPRGNVFHFPQRPDRRFLAAGNGNRIFRDLPRDTRRHPGRSGSDGQRRLNAGAVLYLYAGRLCLHGRHVARHVTRASNIADPTDFAAT